MNLPAYNPAVSNVSEVGPPGAVDPQGPTVPQVSDRYALDLELDEAFGSISCKLAVTTAEPYRTIVNTITVDGTEIEAVETFTVSRAPVADDNVHTQQARAGRGSRVEPRLLLQLSIATTLPDELPVDVMGSLESSGRSQVRTELENMKRLLEHDEVATT